MSMTPRSSAPPAGPSVRPFDSDCHLSRSSPLWAAFTRHPEPTGFQYDLRPGFEVAIVLSGEREMIAPQALTPTKIEMGQLSYAPMWEFRGTRIASPDTETVDLRFLAEFLGDELLGDLPWICLFAVPHSQRPWLGDEVRAKVLEIGHTLRNEVTAREVGWETIVKTHLLYLLILLRRAWVERPRRGPGEPEVGHGDLARLLPALSELHADPTRRITLAQVSQKCGLSVSRFSLLFHRTLGLSFQQFALRARLNQAAQRLLSTDLTTEQLALELGFVDGSHLYRRFIKHYGCTPAEYRRRVRE